RCPICKARLKPETPNCPRCGSDLSIPLSIEEQADSLFSQAIEELSKGQFDEAVRAVEQSLLLKQEPMVLALQQFIRRERKIFGMPNSTDI
ncbi:MAG: hypothetical protein KAI17_01775, partial [Thiotrichaceae bacterium]|nr:hypothetical protein [Thiotrichaceae bacterium]